jgi:hypothetical protein
MSFRVRIEGVPTEGVLREIIEAAREAGADEVVVETTHEAGEDWLRVGFSEQARIVAAPVETLEQALNREKAPSFGSIHLQTDDAEPVVRMIRAAVPRLPGGSRGSVVMPSREGWTSVYDELCDRNPAMLRRLAVELSNRSGALVLSLGVEEGEVVRYIALERGRVVDEYLSVPEFFGALPPGDVIGLGANARLMGRLTGADPDRIRDVAVTAASPLELPPAAELVAAIAAALGIGGGAHGYEAARLEPGAIDLAH